MRTKIVGIAGVATVGKDLFTAIARDILKKHLIESTRLAFADALKKDADEFLQKYSKISVFTTNPEEKKKIRPFLVWFGCFMREETGGKHWVDKVMNTIDANLVDTPDTVYIISDVRFPNEAKTIQERGGQVIHLKKYKNSEQMEFDEHGKLKHQKIYTPYANEEEAYNDPLVEKAANFTIEWQDLSGEVTTIEELKAIQSPVVDYALRAVNAISNVTCSPM